MSDTPGVSRTMGVKIDFDCPICGEKIKGWLVQTSDSVAIPEGLVRVQMGVDAHGMINLDCPRCNGIIVIEP